MVTEIIKALAIFGIFLFLKPEIDIWQPMFRYLGYLAGIGWPIAIVGDPICTFIHNVWKTRIIENSTMRVFAARARQMAEETPYKNPYTEPIRETPPSLLTPAQIEQLEVLRKRTLESDLSQFPKISIAGYDFTNVVDGTGVFTARIKRKNPNGELLNLVVMLSTVKAIREFDSMRRSLPDTDKNRYWAKGYLLPARAGACYSVLFVIDFHINYNRVHF